jgi:hypothetical protein
MGTIIFFLLSMFFQTQGKSYSEVMFESFTRGGRLSLTIKADSLIIMEDDVEMKFSVLANDWKKLAGLLDKLEIEKIGSYPAPSSGRSSDAAWHSTIKITVNGKTYASSEFDNRNAPSKLKDVMNYITEIEKRYSKKR